MAASTLRRSVRRCSPFLVHKYHLSAHANGYVSITLASLLNNVRSVRLSNPVTPRRHYIIELDRRTPPASTEFTSHHRKIRI